jgi:hypothetical protein
VEHVYLIIQIKIEIYNRKTFCQKKKKDMTTLKKDASSISVMVDTNANLFETTIVYIPFNTSSN